MDTELTDADVLDTLEYFALGAAVASPSSSSAEGPSCSLPLPSAPAPPRSAPGGSQKQELAYLRAKVHELELQLRAAEQVNGARLAREGDSLWQRVAQQQNVERQKAVSENARLREQLEAQLKFSRALEKALRKRPSLGAFGNDSVPLERRKRQAATRVTKSLFEELAGSAEQEVRRVHDMLREMQVHEIFRDHRSVDVRAAEFAPVIRVEMVEVRRFPFPFQAVAREWWQFISQSGQLEQVVDGLSRKVESLDGTQFTTSSLQFPVGSHVAVLSATAAFRRLDTDDHSVIAYISRGECSAKKNPKGKFAIVETGWIRAMPLPEAPGSCILQCAGRFIPTLCRSAKDTSGSSDSDDRDASATPPDTPVEAGILTEVIFTAYQKTANFLYAAIENVLMDEQLRHTQAQPIEPADEPRPPAFPRHA